MAKKFGEDFAREWIAKGPRELGGLFFHDSNIAQPMYPLRGDYSSWKGSNFIEPEKQESSYEQLHPVGPGRDDHGRDDLDRGIERE